MHASELIELLKTLPADTPVDFALTPTGPAGTALGTPAGASVEDTEPDRPRAASVEAASPRSDRTVLSDAIAILTEAARLAQPGDTPPDGERDRLDFAEFVTKAVAAAAANIGSIGGLLAGRTGSWEAEQVRNMLYAIVGDEADLHRHRTEPLTVVVPVADVLDDLGYGALYVQAHEELRRQEDAIEWPDEDGDTAAQDAEVTRIYELIDRLCDLEEDDEAAYARAFRQQVLAAADEVYPDLPVPVHVVIQQTWDGPDEWCWSPADMLWSIARERTPLPGSGIAPANYTAGQMADLVATEHAAGRDPLTRINDG